MKNIPAEQIENGQCSLGIELGSTRIKAVLVNANADILAIGTHDWENVYENGIWTYHLEDVVAGLQSCYASLKNDVQTKYGIVLKKLKSFGISAMMHGYIALDRDGNLLAPFRTWRNTATEVAADELTELFRFNIPQRWSIAHYWQQAIDGEAHINKIDKLMTLACYVHYLLSGMFPTVANESRYDPEMVEKLNKRMQERNIPYKIQDILPVPLAAGQAAGKLTPEGAQLLDPTGDLQPGVAMCPPEGDAGTGMVATNSVRPLTGNISAGTSVFAMIVLNNQLSRYYREIDVVATPAGPHVAMVHCNNCSSELNAFADMFAELQGSADRGSVLSAMFQAAENAEPDCGGIVCCNYLSGEHITGFSSGRPLIARTPDSRFTLGNFARAMAYSAFATIKLGMEILSKENIRIACMMGHGGLFKSAFTARVVAAAVNAKVATMETAGEGGAWGIALLAAYMADKKDGERLEDYLERTAFRNADITVTEPSDADLQGFDVYIQAYKNLLLAERTAVDNL